MHWADNKKPTHMEQTDEKCSYYADDDYHTYMFPDLLSGRPWSANLPNPAGSVLRILPVRLRDGLGDALSDDDHDVCQYHADVATL